MVGVQTCQDYLRTSAMAKHPSASLQLESRRSALPTMLKLPAPFYRILTITTHPFTGVSKAKTKSEAPPKSKAQSVREAIETLVSQKRDVTTAGALALLQSQWATTELQCHCRATDRATDPLRPAIPFLPRPLCPSISGRCVMFGDDRFVLFLASAIVVWVLIVIGFGFRLGYRVHHGPR